MSQALPLFARTAGCGSGSVVEELKLLGSGLLRTAILLPHALVRPLAILVGLTLVVFLGILMHGKPRLAQDRAHQIEVSPPPSAEVIPTPSPWMGSTTDPELAPGSIVSLKEAFDYQLKDYKSKLDRLDANIKLQALFVVFTVLLVLRRSDSLNLFGNQLPLQWLHLFVPAVMIYLWLSFGFLLDDLIYSRLWAVRALEEFSRATSHHGKLLFQDSGFVDGWFLTFVDTKGLKIGDYSGIDQNSRASTATLLLIIFGTLLSATHACIVSMALIGYRRYVRRLFRRFLLSYYLLPLIPIAILIVSHLQFAYGGSNRNFMQLYIASMTIPLCGILLLLSVIVDRRVDPASVQCLRRVRRLEDGGPLFPPTHNGNRKFRTISLIADSLGTRFYLGSLPGTFFRTWGAWKGTWFAADPDHESKIESVFEKVSALVPISATVHASARAKVDSNGSRTFIDLLTNTRHFSHQVDEVLLGEFPDVLLLWIGHNNLDWIARVNELTDELSDDLATEFTDAYRHQMRRLLKSALRSKRRVVLVVYGLINFESFFQARREAERRRTLDSTLYPYLEKDYEYFASMRPEHRDGVLRLAQLCNEKLKEMCRRLDEEIRKSDIHLIYSDALSRAEISEVEMLNKIDAWHPSIAGHRTLARSAYGHLSEELSYLGWVRD